MLRQGGLNSHAQSHYRGFIKGLLVPLKTRLNIAHKTEHVATKRVRSSQPFWRCQHYQLRWLFGSLPACGKKKKKERGLCQLKKSVGIAFADRELEP